MERHLGEQFPRLLVSISEPIFGLIGKGNV